MNQEGPIRADGVHRVEFEVDGRRIELESGRIARQAEAAVLVREGRAVLLVTVVRAPNTRGSGFLPLTVEYREKMASAGRIPGSFQRREGRISDDEILASRILDRTLRPLFPKGFEDEVQVQAQVLSAEPRHAEAPLLALIGACAAVHLSSLPWTGPTAGLRIVRVDGGWRAFPSQEQRDNADVDLIVSAGRDGLVMVEGGARQVAEEVAVEGLSRAQSKLKDCLAALDRLRELAGKEKTEFRPPAPRDGEAALDAWLEQEAGTALSAALQVTGKHERRAALKSAMKDCAQRCVEALAGDDADRAESLRSMARDKLHSRCNALIRQRVLDEGRRLDGRGPKDVRPIASEVDWLPSPHGSALFTRGETQAMVSCTLASQRLEQSVDTLRGLETRRFLLHYNFPPYSVGETRPLRGPGRREIGHGVLARRALEAVLPRFEDFPYVLRIESDISESNGSSSMATVCGGCLAMMDAGVPIDGMVAGIAMGLISDGERFEVLSDILGDEDHLGDMDFKVAGTREGITALQMDNKLGSLPESVLTDALAQAKLGRLHILDCMAAVIDAPRAEPKPHAPRVTGVPISVASLPELIGPRGANIKDIEASCDVKLTIDEEKARCYVYAAEGPAAAAAVKRVNQAAGVVQEGRLYRGVVETVKDFGAFVQIFRSAEGLVHVSEWDREHIDDLTKLVQEGDEVVVRVRGVDGRGRLVLSRADALDAGGEDIVN